MPRPETMAGWFSGQLADVGTMLVKAKIVTRREIRRHGVRVALHNALEKSGVLPAREFPISRIPPRRQASR
jgi:hypothetical protein